MKKIILTAMVLCLFSTPAIAEDFCEILGNTAGTIMKARQMSYPASKVIGAFHHDEGIKVIVLDAYSEPRYGTEKFIQMSISDFKNKWYIECVKGGWGKGK